MPVKGADLVPESPEGTTLKYRARPNEDVKDGSTPSRLAHPPVKQLIDLSWYRGKSEEMSR